MQSPTFSLAKDEALGLGDQRPFALSPVASSRKVTACSAFDRPSHRRLR